ncbi:MAG TPA: SDR family oxidoreductase [Herpetosiphonaceae bacterium]
MDTNLRGRTALVTGASSGLGVDFARHLAARGCNLILVARRENQLRAVQEEIRRRYGVDVQIIPMDLATDDAPQALYDQIKAAGKQVDVLINNAGYGLYGQFTEIEWEREKNMLELDIITLMHLTKLFVKDMVARNFGFILLVSSIGAYQPSPLYASYSAAKSFVLNFGEALSYELRKTNVRCTVISPGITATEFLKVSGQQASLYQRLAMMKSEDVTRIGIESMLKGKPSVVPGRLNTLSVWSNRLLPRRLSAAVAYRLMS